MITTGSEEEFIFGNMVLNAHTNGRNIPNRSRNLLCLAL